MKKILFITILQLFILHAFSQIASDTRIEPPFWWTGMENDRLQLLVHKENVSQFTRASINTQDIRIEGLRTVQSPNYLFIDLVLTPELKAGNYNIVLTHQDKSELYSFDYEFRMRKTDSAMRSSFDASDVIYLLMPDRFANGDPKNDSAENAIEKANRDLPGGRHGGDIEGIISKLDYLADLGISALWSTPLLFDNETTYSYHGYATADYYQIDPRYGSNEDYKRLANECHKRGIKLILDVVTNHCGAAHWWMKDLPQEDWVHQFSEFTKSNHRKQTINDPYAAKGDVDLYEEGWFDLTMPDLNQGNDLVLNYYLQNTIWWIEYADVDGLRVDTYPYNDKVAIAEWTKAILQEYPNLNIVGECWQHKPSELAYWQSGVKNHDGYDSYLPSGMDFVLTDQLEKAFNEDEQNWDFGVARFYNSLSTDYLYADPFKLMILLDNHDITRYAGTLKNDPDKYKMALSFLLTTRGIPQLYAGTEIMMDGYKSKGDADIRRDFPGGWPGDERDAFTKEGRTKIENEIFNHTRSLLHYRKNNPVLQFGKLTHYIPEDNIYVYFRSDESKTVMVILNNNPEKRVLPLERFKSNLADYELAKDIITNKVYPNLDKIEIDGKTALVVELMHYVK